MSRPNIEAERAEAKMWSVWVGGGEVNDNLLTLEEAENTYDYWKGEGFADVKIEESEVI